jgi:hypothetical protein
MIEAKESYEKLRGETAAMLGFGSEPSLIQGLQIDLIALLRLEIDTMQGEVFSGAPVDLDRLSTALQMSQKLLPEASLRATPIAQAMPDGTAESVFARAKLITLLDGYAEDRRRQLAANPNRAREQLEVEIAAALEQYPPPPAPAVEVLPAPSPAEAAPEPSPTNVVPLREGIDVPMKAPSGYSRAVSS